MQHEITTVFRTLYGEHVPEPEAVFCTRWCSNRYTCGAFSSLARGCSPVVAQDLKRNIGNLHFAGTSLVMVVLVLVLVLALVEWLLISQF